MTVILRHHETLELNRVDYADDVLLEELSGLAEFQAAEPSWLRFDCLNVVTPGANFSAIAFAALDALFTRYRTLFAPLSFPILRRSVWMCQSPAAEPHVRYWLGERDTREGMSSDVRPLSTFEEAGQWLVLSPRRQHCSKAAGA